MDFTTFHAGKNDDGRRTDRILKNFLAEEKLSSLYKSLRKGFVKVNGKKVEGGFKISEGDEIKIADFLLKSEETENSAHGAKSLPQSIVLFKNEHLLILNKPYDIPVQPSANKTVKSLSEMVEEDFSARKSETSLSFRTGPLHRLDRKTTGLIVFSQSIDGARIFSEAIQKHTVEKIYLGLMIGTLLGEAEWRDKIEKNGSESEKSFHTVKVSEINGENGKISDTRAIPLKYGVVCGKKVTLAKFIIGSGRTHQIRAQSARHGFPLLGDKSYGGAVHGQNLGQDFFLHAYELKFKTEELRNSLALPESIQCEPPKKFLEICSNFTPNP